MIRPTRQPTGPTRHGAPGTRVQAADGTKYVVRGDGALQRLIPKVKGKAAAKHHKKRRRQRRLYPAMPREVQMEQQAVDEQKTTTQDTPADPPAEQVASAQGDGDGGTSEEKTD